MLAEIGMENIASHIEKLTQDLLSVTGDLGIAAKTPPDSAGPLVVLQSKDSALFVQKLVENGIIASNRHDGIRISFHVYNTADDVKAVADVLEQNMSLMVLAPAGAARHD